MSETIGLDIGSHSIKLAGLKKTSRGPFLTCFGLKKIPQGIEQEDVHSISTLLKDLIEETGITTKKIRLTVSGSGIQIRRMTMPSIPKNELIQALSWEMKEHLPFPVEKARMQYYILGDFIEDKVKKFDLLTVACPNDLIDRTLSIVNGAGLQVSHLNISAFALWNMLLAADQFKIGETVALIDLGSEKMSLYLFKDEILQFSREMTPGGADLTRAVTDGIPFERDLGFLYEKAEKIKEEVGILSGTQEERQVDESIDLSKISFLMRPVLERWTAEIGRSLDYYRHQFYAEKIDRILITGGGAHLKNLASYLENELRFPVEPFNPLKEMLYDAQRVDGRTLDRIGSMFTTAAGVALSEPKRIEFLPATEPFWHKSQNEKWILMAIPLVTALIFLGIVFHTGGRLTTLQKEHDEKMARVEKLENLRSGLALLKEKERKMKQDLSLFPSPAISPVPYRDILKEVNQMIPGNVTLTSLEIQSEAMPSKNPTPESKAQEAVEKEEGKKNLYIGGLAFGNDLHCLTALAQIIEGLERSSRFSNVKLLSTDENKLYNQLAVGFDISCDIDLNHVPSPPSPKGKGKP